MSALIWDSTSQAFKEAEIPKIWDADNNAFADSQGKVWDSTQQAWVDAWGSGKVYLYNEGDECTKITGGWVAPGFSGYYQPSIGVKNTDNLFVRGTSDHTGTGFRTNNNMSFANYNKLCAEIITSGTSSSDWAATIDIYTSLSDDDNVTNFSTYVHPTKTVVEIDISSISVVGWVVLWTTNNTSRSMYVYRLWLEK